MKTSQLLWLLLLFIGSSTIQGQALKVYDQQKLLDSVKYYGLEKVVQKDSARLHQIGAEKVKQLYAFLNKVQGGCYSVDGWEKVQEEGLLRQSKIIGIDSLLQDVLSYRDSISAQLIDQHLESYREKGSAHLVEVGNVIYHEGPIIDESNNIITFMRDSGVFTSIIQRYNHWLLARAKYYELDDLFKDLR